MYWKLLAVFCVAALFPDPSHGMYSCRGNRFQKITPGSTYLLDSRGTYWWGSKCYNAYTDVGYQLVVDCTASSGGYLDLSGRFSWNRNVFWFYPRNKRFIYGCGRHDNLVSNRPLASAKRSRFIVLAGTLQINIATSN